MTRGQFHRGPRLIVAALLFLPLPVYAATPQTRQSGEVANSTVGQVGRRQSRDQPVANVQPQARLDSRINSRVQSRIQNRIDRNYDTQANATSSFEIAEQQIRAVRTPR